MYNKQNTDGKQDELVLSPLPRLESVNVFLIEHLNAILEATNLVVHLTYLIQALLSFIILLDAIKDKIGENC